MGVEIRDSATMRELIARMQELADEIDGWSDSGE
jgi:hypothetical protein